ncbi:MAG: UDP-glucuronosyltransferase [Candidatus Nitrosothermus koennekii]|nr:MAG: UDP-glucuronosyltransferase [Candidatus Nitrosothermus koennekii]
MLYFTSPIGLGHASRDIAIASAFNARFVTGEPAYAHLKSNGFEAVNAYRRMDIKTEHGSFTNKLSWMLDYISYYRECKEIASMIIKEYNPDLIISDEDFAAISVSNCKKVLITDIFESRFLNGLGSLLERSMNKRLKKIIASADIVIAPMHGDDHDNIVYTGPIVRKIDKSRDELRREFGFDGKVIVACIGGTSAGKFLLDAVIKAYDAIKDRARLIIVAGPSLDYNADIEHYSYVKNLHEMIYAADLLISLAGRSTIDEAKVYGTPAIFIPIKGHFEQEANAMEEGFRFDDINRLDELILEYLEKGRCIRAENGVGKAISAIKSII